MSHKFCIEQYEGEIFASSVLGEGATFNIVMPVHAPELAMTNQYKVSLRWISSLC